jgi:hypothetical protein
MRVSDVVGWAGAVAVVVTYAHAARNGLGPRHHLGNAFGGGALAFGAVMHGAWPAAAENLVWVALAVYGLRRLLAGHRPPVDAPAAPVDVAAAAAGAPAAAADPVVASEVG